MRSIAVPTLVKIKSSGTWLPGWLLGYLVGLIGLIYGSRIRDPEY